MSCGVADSRRVPDHFKMNLGQILTEQLEAQSRDKSKAIKKLHRVRPLGIYLLPPPVACQADMTSAMQ